MDSLTAARWQMEVSLAFHMVFAALGIAMPLLMLLAEWRFLRTGEAQYGRLARTWGKATALLFVVGAVSGTALSFELGLLWPRFMAFAGPIIGSTFALEGFAFFLEAIFIGLYLYGWEKLSPRAHFLCGIPVAVTGVASGVLVVAANAWMQVPRGFTAIVDGRAVGVDPTAPFLPSPWLVLALHSSLACYAAVGAAVAGVYAIGVLRGRAKTSQSRSYHQSALAISITVAVVALTLQMLSGHQTAQLVARTQPEKLAAAEAHFETMRGAPVVIGGIPDTRNRAVHGAIHIPKLLSILATDSLDGEVKGLAAFPERDWPNVPLVHTAFDVMVGAGSALLGVLGLSVMFGRKGRLLERRWILWAIALASPLGMVALEAGWIVTEAGRQPWTIYRVMRTADAVTPAAHVPLTFLVFSILYTVLGVVLVALLRSIAKHAPMDENPASEAPHAAG